MGGKEIKRLRVLNELKDSCQKYNDGDIGLAEFEDELSVIMKKEGKLND